MWYRCYATNVIVLSPLEVRKPTDNQFKFGNQSQLVILKNPQKKVSQLEAKGNPN